MTSTSLESLLATKEIVVCCGSGGVGKTTVAASAALGAASRLGGKVLVLTIDPAKRLADALGLELQSFVHAVRGDRETVVTGAEGRAALRLALQVTEAVERSPLGVPTGG